MEHLKHQSEESLPDPASSADRHANAAITQILRILVTSSCNYSCTYCHSEGMSPDAQQEMNLEDFLFVADAGLPLLEGFAIAGGEPLLYPDLASLCLQIWTTTGKKVHLTTNSSMTLFPLHSAFHAIARINLSINSLNPHAYKMITGVNMPRRVLLANADLLSKSQIEVHTNTVLLPELTTSMSAIREIVDFCNTYGFVPEFLHFIPRVPAEAAETCDALNQFRASVRALGLRPSNYRRPFSHPNTLYEGDSTRLILRDFGQVPTAGVCRDCGMRSYCSEGFCHVRISPDGTMSACRAGAASRGNVLPYVRTRDAEAVREILGGLQGLFPLRPEWAQLFVARRNQSVGGYDWRF